VEWPSRDEQQRAQDAGFPILGGHWGVAADYRIVNGALAADGPVTRRYLPAAHAQLPTELAKVDAGGDAALLGFARDWGSLGYARLVLADDTLTEDQQDQRTASLGGGDPVPWIRAHAHGIQVCLTLLGHLTTGSANAERDLGAYLDSMRTGADGDLELVYGARHASRRATLASVFVSDGENLERAWSREIISAMVNPNLRALHPQLDNVHGAPSFVLNYQFVGLTDIIYWHLAQFVLGQLGLARCQECGAFFPQSDKRQRFCPPPEWESTYSREHGGRTESRCAKRARMRRLRAKDKTTSQKGERDGEAGQPGRQHP
jgi:hypothetical protein